MTSARRLAAVPAGLALVLALAAALAAAPASAAKRMELAVQDEGVLLDRAFYDRERALAQARSRS
jgi:hypothetical protein